MNSETKQGPIISLTNLISFLSCLKNLNYDGRVVLFRGKMLQERDSKDDQIRSRDDDVHEFGDLTLQYSCLNPSGHFQPIVADAASVVLIGGTMQPFSHVESFLLQNVDKGRLKYFACPHVIKDSNVFTHLLSVGPDGTSFDFRFSSRLLDSTVTSLKLAIR